MNATTNNGNTALMCAAKNVHGKCVRLLRAAGADVNIASRDGSTALIDATSHGSEECVKLLIEAGADVNVSQRDGTSVLIMAASKGSHACINLLLDAGADVNVTDAGGFTALITAATHGYEKCVERLLKEQVKIDRPTTHENRRWSWVQRAAKVKSFQKYLKSSNFLPASLRKNFRENPSSQESMKEYINTVNNFGCSALMLAAESDSVQSIEFLINAGADVNMCTYEGGSALSRAAFPGNTNCVNKLLQSGADVNLFCQKGQPSHFNYGFFQFLPEQNDGRLTALNSAVKNGKYECAELLIKSGAEVNLFDGFGDTALLRAVKSECDASVVFKCVQVLLKEGALVNKTNIYKQNALKYYVTENKSLNKDLVMLLFAAGETLDETHGWQIYLVRIIEPKTKSQGA